MREVALLQAKRDQQKVVDQVRQWFAQQPDFVAAAAKIKKAQADVDAAIKPVKDAVEGTQGVPGSGRAEGRCPQDTGSGQ